jgi:hypothetical protein
MKLQGTLRHGIFFLSSVSVLSLFMTGIVHSKDEVKLMPEYMASGKWVIPGISQFEGTIGDCGNVKFTKDGHFTMDLFCGAEYTDNINVAGTYKIKSNKITFIVETKSKEESKLRPGDSFDAELKAFSMSEDSEVYAIEYRWCLALNIDKKYHFDKSYRDKIFNSETRIKAGEAVKIKGIDAVYMGAVQGTVTAALKVRVAPDAAAKEVTFGKACVDGNEVEAKSIEKGARLTIYGRTKDMVKTGKWNNYWYYVTFDTVVCEGHGGGAGWVFGEFVKIK